MGISLPWILYKFLILGQIPGSPSASPFSAWPFIVTPTLRRDGAVPSPPWRFSSPATAGIALLATAFAGLVYGAATGRIGLLRNPILVWLGAISYHPLPGNEISAGCHAHLRAAGWKTDATILAAIAVSLILASLITSTVERPAMNRIRAWYRQKTAFRRWLIVSLVANGVLVALWLRGARLSSAFSERDKAQGDQVRFSETRLYRSLVSTARAMPPHPGAVVFIGDSMIDRAAHRNCSARTP